MKLTFLLFLFFGIYTNTQAQIVNKADPPPDCPPGTHPVLVQSFDGFNFHRPITNCQTGFWFCFKNASGWSWTCVPDTYKATLVNNDNDLTANCFVKLNGNFIEFHIPSGIKNLSSYSKNDLSTFSVDDQWIYQINNTKYQLVTGSYPTVESNGEYIISVNYLIIP